MDNENKFTSEEIKKAFAVTSSIGGKAKMARMTPEERSQMAKAMADARWERYRAERAANALIGSAFAGKPITGGERTFVFEDVNLNDN